MGPVCPLCGDPEVGGGSLENCSPLLQTTVINKESGHLPWSRAGHFLELQ